MKIHLSANNTQFLGFHPNDKLAYVAEMAYLFIVAKYWKQAKCLSIWSLVHLKLQNTASVKRMEHQDGAISKTQAHDNKRYTVLTLLKIYAQPACAQREMHHISQIQGKGLFPNFFLRKKGNRPLYSYPYKTIYAM